MYQKQSTFFSLDFLLLLRFKARFTRKEKTLYVERIRYCSRKILSVKNFQRTSKKLNQYIKKTKLPNAELVGLLALEKLLTSTLNFSTHTHQLFDFAVAEFDEDELVSVEVVPGLRPRLLPMGSSMKN